jgi:hypothetical protein
MPATKLQRFSSALCGNSSSVVLLVMSGADGDRVRKRKWDSAPVGALQQHGEASVVPVTEAALRAQAAAAAAAIAARLTAASPRAVAEKPALASAPSNVVVTETLDLCSLPAQARALLTKRGTQDEVARITGVAVNTKCVYAEQSITEPLCSLFLTCRGRFIPPGTLVLAGDVPLHLVITPGAKLLSETVERKRQAVGQALGLLTELIANPNALRNVYVPPPVDLPPPPPPPPLPPPSAGLVGRGSYSAVPPPPSMHAALLAGAAALPQQYHPPYVPEDTLNADSPASLGVPQRPAVYHAVPPPPPPPPPQSVAPAAPELQPRRRFQETPPGSAT